ncbi:MAG: tetratricopeptide repeat protein [Flavobacteriales bacterium]|nr:tetratricopeptide repeat protein [Flavobacteriales bacterium]
MNIFGPTKEVDKTKHAILIWVIIFIGYGQNSCAQNSSVFDSLREAMETAENDTDRIRSILLMAERYVRIDPDSSRKLAENALELSHELHWSKGVSDAHHIIGYSYYAMGDLDSALINWRKTMELRADRQDLKALADSYNNIGLIYRQMSDYPQALNYLFKALSIKEGVRTDTLNAEEVKKLQLSTANTNNNIGLIYWEEGSLVQALEFFYKALDIYKQFDELSLSLAQNLANIGIVFHEQQEFEQSLIQYRKAIDIYREVGDLQGAAAAYGNIAANYVEIFNRGDTIDGIYGAPLLDTALILHESSLKIFNQHHSDFHIIVALGGIGDTYRLMGEYHKAIDNYTRSCAIADSMGASHELSRISALLADAYVGINDFERALASYKTHTTLKDSTFNEEKSKEIGKLEAKYEMETAQAEKQRIEDEQARRDIALKNRRDNLQYSGILIFIVLIFSLVFMLGKITVPVRLAEGMIFFSFLLFFEFSLVLLDPYIERYSSGGPALKLGFNALLAAAIFPLHSLFESRLKKRLLQKQ